MKNHWKRNSDVDLIEAHTRPPAVLISYVPILRELTKLYKICSRGHLPSVTADGAREEPLIQGKPALCTTQAGLKDEIPPSASDSGKCVGNTRERDAANGGPRTRRMAVKRGGQEQRWAMCKGWVAKVEWFEETEMLREVGREEGREGARRRRERWREGGRREGTGRKEGKE